MAKRNSSGSSAGRRGPARSSSGKFSSSSNFSGKSSRKPDDDNTERRKRPASGTSKRGTTGPSYKKFDKPFGKTTSGGESNPDKKFEKKPYGRSSARVEENNSTEKRGRNKSFANEPSARPYKKFSKPFSKREDPTDKNFEKKPLNRSSARSKDSSTEKKLFSKPTQKDSSARPYKKFTRPFETARSERPITKKFRTRKPVSDEVPHADSDIIRLNKYISNSGVCSRREADEFIKMGLVSVNGTVITELGYKVKRSDEVRYEDKVLKAEKPVYILINKPKGFLTTTKDPQERKTVMHILGSAVKERVYPVGRLDRNTTGLLLLTNDGDLADKLMHPSYNAKKIYKVELDRPITKADFQKIRDGVHLEEGKAIVDDLAIISDDGKTVGIEIHIGWNRVVRRIFESLQYQVEKLDRSFYAGLDKKDLPRGHWRYLKKEEIVLLKHYK